MKNSMFQLISDIECNKCHAVYKTNAPKVMTLMVDNVCLSICPKCTKEVANLMGYTPENITKELAHIKLAETENNKKRAIEWGEVCSKCEKKFVNDEVRVREGNSSNVPSYHLSCFEK